VLSRLTSCPSLRVPPSCPCPSLRVPPSCPCPSLRAMHRRVVLRRSSPKRTKEEVLLKGKGIGAERAANLTISDGVLPPGFDNIMPFLTIQVRSPTQLPRGPLTRSLTPAVTHGR
jgi:hypothetical protein